MRVAILSESPADEASLRIIVEAVLGIKTVSMATNLRSRGWPAVRNILPTIARQLHYRTDTEALIVVADSNHTRLSGNPPKSRLCELQEVVQACQLKPLPGRLPLKIAVGVAMPAIEAWWLCKTHPHISEAAWERGLVEERDPYTKLELKKLLYGAEINSLDRMTQKMVESAEGIKNDLTVLERAFPHGYGCLAKEIRSWRRLG